MIDDRRTWMCRSSLHISLRVSVVVKSLEFEFVYMSSLLLVEAWIIGSFADLNILRGKNVKVIINLLYAAIS